MSPRRMLMFLGVNVLVSIATTLLVLTFWESRQGTVSRIPTTAPPTLAVATFVPPTTEVQNTTLGQSTSQPVDQPGPTGAGQKTYVVEQGDTLLAISQKFDVSLNDLMKANNLTEESILNIGQKLVIPGQGGPAATATPASSATSSPSTPQVIPSPIPTAVIGEGPVSLSIQNVVSRGDLQAEAVILANDGDPVRLDGWTLTDNRGKTYTFPGVVLFKGGEIAIHTGSGSDTPTDLYWGQAAAQWGDPGITVFLKDSTGTVRAQLQLP